MSLQERGIEVPVPEMEHVNVERRTGPEAKTTKQAVGRSGSLRWRDHGGRSDDEHDIVGGPFDSTVNTGDAF